MKYALLIYADESTAPPDDSPEMAELMKGYFAFSAEVRDVTLGGDALLGTDTATTVRVRDGETLVTDGPFAETKEQLGGFYLLDCDDLDQAIAYAAKIPDAARGSIEVRPVWEVPADVMEQQGG